LVLLIFTTENCRRNGVETSLGKAYWVLCRVLVRLPDRPGSLGRVTTLLGRLGVDIRQVLVLRRDGNTATDAFTVTVPGSVIYRCLPELG
jgi:hypothetical protein